MYGRTGIIRSEDPQVGGSAVFENYIKTNKQKYNIFIFRGFVEWNDPHHVEPRTTLGTCSCAHLRERNQMDK